MVPGVALPDLEGCPQHGRECAASYPLVPTSLSCPPTSLFHQWGDAVNTGPCCLLTSFCSMLSTAEATAPGFSCGSGRGDCPFRTVAPTPIRLLWLCLLEMENSWKHLICGCPPLAPTQHQKQTAEGVAPMAQLKPGRNVSCCVMTKVHMLIASISQNS